MGLVFFFGSGEESPERMPDAESQWSTLKSGPLARAERREKGWKPGGNGRASGPLLRVAHWLGRLAFLGLT